MSCYKSKSYGQSLLLQHFSFSSSKKKKIPIFHIRDRGTLYITNLSDKQARKEKNLTEHAECSWLLHVHAVVSSLLQSSHTLMVKYMIQFFLSYICKSWPLLFLFYNSVCIFFLFIYVRNRSSSIEPRCWMSLSDCVSALARVKTISNQRVGYYPGCA